LWFAGGSEGYWVAFYKFGAHIGIKFTDEQTAALRAWAKYAETCGPLYPYDGLAFVSRRPDLIKFDDQQQLHSEVGPAMRFPSGFAIHAWHGTRVSAEWIDDKSFLTAEIALSQENTALRIAAMQIVGWPKMIEQLDAKVINRHPEGLLGGELLAVKKAKFNPLERGEMRFLRAECPRNGIICFRVPDDTKTAHEAQAWKAGLPPSIYQLPATRT
jgi:hypothetical protein